MQIDLGLAKAVLIYISLTLMLGLLATRLVRNTEDFISAGRKLPLVMNSMALFAFWYGSETVLGAGAAFMQGGFLAVIEDPFGGFLCLLLFGTFLVRPLYRRNLMTLGDLFREQFGQSVERLGSLCMILSFVGYVAAQMLALSFILHVVFGIDSQMGVLLASLIVCVYTIAGGMWAVSVTDLVQSVVIISGLLILTIYFTTVTGFAPLSSNYLNTLPADFFNFFPEQQEDSNLSNWLDYLAAWTTLGLGSLVSQDIFQRANAARSESIAVQSTLLGACLYLLFAMLPLYLGILVRYLEPGLALSGDEQAILTMVDSYAPFWLRVLFFGALLSAIFSTCSGALLAPSTVMAENLLAPLLGRANSLLILRVSVLLVAVISTVLALGDKGIYELVAQSSILGAVSVLVPMLYGLLWQGRNSLAALLSMISGLGIYLGAEYGAWFHSFPAVFAGIIASALGLVWGIMFSRLSGKSSLQS